MSEFTRSKKGKILIVSILLAVIAADLLPMKIRILEMVLFFLPTATVIPEWFWIRINM